MKLTFLEKTVLHDPSHRFKQFSKYCLPIPRETLSNWNSNPIRLKYRGVLLYMHNRVGKRKEAKKIGKVDGIIFFSLQLNSADTAE